MKKGELHDILYRLTISLSNKNKLYNFFKQFIDLFKGDKIDEKYFPESYNELKNKISDFESRITALETSLANVQSQLESI